MERHWLMKYSFILRFSAPERNFCADQLTEMCSAASDQNIRNAADRCLIAGQSVRETTGGRPARYTVTSERPTTRTTKTGMSKTHQSRQARLIRAGLQLRTPEPLTGLHVTIYQLTTANIDSRRQLSAH